MRSSSTSEFTLDDDDDDHESLYRSITEATADLVLPIPDTKDDEMSSKAEIRRTKSAGLDARVTPKSARRVTIELPKSPFIPEGVRSARKSFRRSSIKRSSSKTPSDRERDGPPRRISGDRTVCLNVGGQTFEIFRSLILQKPTTRLCWLVDNEAIGISHEDIEYRDNELFFDRDPLSFHFIIQYYRTGKLHSPLNMCGPAFQEELRFWQIDDDIIEPCCWPSYETHLQAADTISMMTQQMMDRTLRNSFVPPRALCCTTMDKVSSYLARQLNHTTSSISLMYATLSTIFTITTVINVSLMSVAHLRTVNGTDSPFYFKPAHYTVRELLVATEPHYVFVTIDIVCSLYFLLEFLFLLASSTNVKFFFHKFLNLVDLLNNTLVLYQYIYLLLHPEYRLDWFISFYFARITRILRLTRHIHGLEIIAYTFRASFPELMLLASLFTICAVVLGTTLYLCEQFGETPSNKIIHIPISIYWAVISLTTVGYGDYSPTSLPGYVIGISTALMAILVIVLPVPIISNNFCLFYSHAQAMMRSEEESHSGKKSMFYKKSQTRRREVRKNVLE